MTRILVTGARGFLGSRLKEKLREAGHEVTATTRDEARARGGDDVPLADALNVAAYANLIQKAGIETVVNLLAAGVDPNDRDHQALLRANSMFPALLAKAAKTAGAKSFVQIGSSAEYSLGDVRSSVAEDNPLTTATVYGASKAAGHLLLHSTASTIGLRTVSLRLFNIFGPGEKAYRLFPSLVASLANGARVPLSAGTQVRDFLFVDDACDAIEKMIAILDTRPVRYPVYNLASGNGVAVRDFALSTAAAMSADCQLLAFGELPMRPDDMPFVVADTARIEAELGCIAKTSLPTAISYSLASQTPRE